MTVDVETLLRDAGREPTVDLDVDAVHSRGRRRMQVRRTALVAASAAVGVVVVGGVAVLSPSTSGVQVTNQPERPGTTGAETVDELLRRGADQGSVTLDVGASEVAAVTDTDLVALEWRQYDGVFDVTRFLASGGQAAWEVATGTPASPVVANDASVWWMSDAGSLHRAASEGGPPTEVQPPDRGYGWLPVGTVAATDEVIVALVPVTPPAAEQRNGLALVAADGTFSDLPVDGDAQVFATGSIVDAHVGRNAVVVGAATNDALVVYAAGFGERLEEIAEVSRRDERPGSTLIAGLGIVGGEVWVVEAGAPTGEGTSVHVYPLDGDADDRTTFEIPATLAEGRWPTGLSVSPDGDVVLLRTTDTTTFEPGTLVVFPKAPGDDPWRGARALDTRGIMSAIRPARVEE